MREFLYSLMTDLGISVGDDGLAQMHRKLNEVLIREARAGRRVIVVIDEVQSLDDSVLETVRMLSNFEIPGMKLMQIILAGQPQLASRLARPQLRQRISIFGRLAELDGTETANYIAHRLGVAGYQGRTLFTQEALRMIYGLSEGIPRNINNICFHAATLAFAERQKIIDVPILNHVREDLDLEMLRPNSDNELIEARQNGREANVHAFRE